MKSVSVIMALSDKSRTNYPSDHHIGSKEDHSGSPLSRLRRKAREEFKGRISSGYLLGPTPAENRLRNEVDYEAARVALEVAKEDPKIRGLMLKLREIDRRGKTGIMPSAPGERLSALSWLYDASAEVTKELLPLLRKHPMAVRLERAMMSHTMWEKNYRLARTEDSFVRRNIRLSMIMSREGYEVTDLTWSWASIEAANALIEGTLQRGGF